MASRTKGPRSRPPALGFPLFRYQRLVLQQPRGEAQLPPRAPQTENEPGTQPGERTFQLQQGSEDWFKTQFEHWQHERLILMTFCVGERCDGSPEARRASTGRAAGIQNTEPFVKAGLGIIRQFSMQSINSTHQFTFGRLLFLVNLSKLMLLSVCFVF